MGTQHFNYVDNNLVVTFSRDKMDSNDMFRDLLYYAKLVECHECLGFRCALFDICFHDFAVIVILSLLCTLELITDSQHMANSELYVVIDTFDSFLQKLRIYHVPH